LVMRAAYADVRLVATAGELPGVSEHVLQRDAQQVGVGGDVQVRFDIEAHLALRIATCQILGDLGSECGQVHRPTVEVVPRHAGEVEQVVDQHAHALHRGAHTLEQHARL